MNVPFCTQIGHTGPLMPSEPGRPVYLERFIHGEIYRVRPDVMSIVHCHAPALIPFGITKVPLRPVYHNSSFVGEGVPVFEIREAGAATDMLVSTPELGRALPAVQDGEDRRGRGHARPELRGAEPDEEATELRRHGS